jgi:hypothetical protein
MFNLLAQNLKILTFFLLLWAEEGYHHVHHRKESSLMSTEIS